MSKQLMYTLISKMHLKLSHIIETNNFDLLNEDVQRYSRRLDKVLTHFNNVYEKDKFSNIPLQRVNASTSSFK